MYQQRKRCLEEHFSQIEIYLLTFGPISRRKTTSLSLHWTAFVRRKEPHWMPCIPIGSTSARSLQSDSTGFSLTRGIAALRFRLEYKTIQEDQEFVKKLFPER